MTDEQWKVLYQRVLDLPDCDKHMVNEMGVIVNGGTYNTGDGNWISEQPDDRRLMSDALFVFGRVGTVIGEKAEWAGDKTNKYVVQPVWRSTKSTAGGIYEFTDNQFSGSMSSAIEYFGRDVNNISDEDFVEGRDIGYYASIVVDEAQVDIGDSIERNRDAIVTRATAAGAIVGGTAGAGTAGVACSPSLAIVGVGVIVEAICIDTGAAAGVAVGGGAGYFIGDSIVEGGTYMKKSNQESLMNTKGKGSPLERVKKGNKGADFKRGSKVKTPDTNLDEFTKMKGGQDYIDKKTGDIWKKTDSTHLGGEKWKVFPKGAKNYTKTNRKATVDGEGNVIGP